MAKSTGCRGERFGIMNHVRSIWTLETFDREEEAQAYLDGQREEWRRKGWGDLSKHRVVRVRVTVSPLATMGGQNDD